MHMQCAKNEITKYADGPLVYSASGQVWEYITVICECVHGNNYLYNKQKD